VSIKEKKKVMRRYELTGIFVSLAIKGLHKAALEVTTHTDSLWEEEYAKQYTTFP
jgi:hypothetical protein